MNLSPVSKNKCGQLIRSGKKQCVINVYKSVMVENPGLLKDSAVEKVAEMVGIGKTSVYKTLADYKRDSVAGLKSPLNKKKRDDVFDKLDGQNKCAIRRKVHEFFFNNEPPTVDKVLQSVNDDDQLPNFKRTSMFKILKKLGFKFSTRGRNSFLTDRDDIILWRRDYLRKIKKYRSEGRPIYFQDETWLNEGHVKSRVWTDSEIKSKKDAFLKGLSTGLKNPSGKGKRLIISHIGNEEGFLKNGELIFESKSSGDYHQEMNGDVFLNYFKRILPLTKDNSVIVLDNAPYHSVKCEKLPTASWNKTQLIDWLAEKGIATDFTMLKKELLKIAKEERKKYDKYLVDEMAKQHNRTLLRLPPYHCELNPIELIWSQVKGYVASHNTTFKLADLKPLTDEALKRVTEKEWKACIAHSMKEEEKLWKLDDIMENMEEPAPFVIHVGNDSDSESDLADELPSD